MHNWEQHDSIKKLPVKKQKKKKKKKKKKKGKCYWNGVIWWVCSNWSQGKLRPIGSKGAAAVVDVSSFFFFFFFFFFFIYFGSFCFIFFVISSCWWHTDQMHPLTFDQGGVTGGGGLTN